VAVNNLAGHGDVLTVSGMFSSADMKFGNLAYDWLLNGKGTHVGASYSGLNYRLGKDMASSQASGTTRTGSMWVKHPVLRSLNTNVSIQLKYDVNQLKDHVGSASIRTDRTISAASLTATGDQKNTYKRGGISSWSLGLKSGNVRFDDSAAESVDALGANTKGQFVKLNLNINHLQTISNKASVSLSASHQWANNNLDGSDKMSVAGSSAVRAYSAGDLLLSSGDTGYVGMATLRYYLTHAFDGSLTGSLFYDTAHITVNKSPWPESTGANEGAISGAGIALDWAGPKQVSANLVVAVPTDVTSALEDKRPSHTVWFNMKKGF
jgi:hemolysin activation/secretion protein